MLTDGRRLKSAACASDLYGRSHRCSVIVQSAAKRCLITFQKTLVQVNQMKLHKCSEHKEDGSVTPFPPVVPPGPASTTTTKTPTATEAFSHGNRSVCLKGPPFVGGAEGPPTSFNRIIFIGQPTTCSVPVEKSKERVTIQPMGAHGVAWGGAGYGAGTLWVYCY